LPPSGRTKLQNRHLVLRPPSSTVFNLNFVLDYLSISNIVITVFPVSPPYMSLNQSRKTGWLIQAQSRGVGRERKFKTPWPQHCIKVVLVKIGPFVLCYSGISTISLPLNYEICFLGNNLISSLLIKMYFNLSCVLAGLTLGSLAFASPILMDKRSTIEEDGVKYTVFEHAATNSVVKFVTNSGICETTPGVNQYSGYFSVGGGMQLVHTNYL
jgi:hypothetical protein